MFKFYQVGESVRNELLSIAVNDYEYVAVVDDSVNKFDMNIIFEAMQIQLKNEGFEVYYTIPSKCRLRAKFPNSHANKDIIAEFVLARKLLGYKPGTHEHIYEAGAILDDLSQRDFTINAIAKNIEGELYDPFGGRKDIEKSILRTPTSSKNAFDEDPIRLLRAIKLAVTKKFTISNDVHRMILYYDYWNKFTTISEKRIADEMVECFKHNTHETLMQLEIYRGLRDFVFKRTNLWLKPTNEK